MVPLFDELESVDVLIKNSLRNVPKVSYLWIDEAQLLVLRLILKVLVSHKVSSKVDLCLDHVRSLIRGQQSEGSTFLACSCCSSCSVDEGLEIRREVKVDDIVQQRNIKSSCSHVRHNQDLAYLLSESSKCFCSSKHVHSSIDKGHLIVSGF